METGFVVLLVILSIVVEVTIWILIERHRKKIYKSQGTIYAYYDDNNSNPSLLLDPDVPIDDIASRKQAVFNVSVIRKNSHE